MVMEQLVAEQRACLQSLLHIFPLQITALRSSTGSATGVPPRPSPLSNPLLPLKLRLAFHPLSSLPTGNRRAVVSFMQSKG